MTTTTTTPRPWRSYDHLRDVITSDAGALTVQPIRAGDIHFDAAKANHLPRNLPEGDHGSSVLDIGRGVQVRASGNARLAGTYAGADQWSVASMYATQYPSGRDLTAAQDHRARALIGELITKWASTHAGDIAQADDIDRNNAAHRLEESIARHETALATLRENLRACEEGEPFSMYPDLPTDRR
jgi:hypothetical protein